MYKLTARQILVIALLSAVFAAGCVALYDRFSNRLQPAGKMASAGDGNFNTNEPKGITNPSVATDEQNNIEVYKAISPGVVFITSTTYVRDFFNVEERNGTGSGSIIDEQGHILTNYHVVEGTERSGKLTVSLGNGKTYPARIVGTDPNTDLAVIQINAPREELTVVPFGDSDRLQVGQKVLAIGNPFGLDRTLTTGVISGLQRPIRARNGRPIEGAIQTDASINPGNSGGPLLDSHGRMVGINSQILSPSGASNGVGFAVPVNIAKRVVPQLIRNGQVIRPQLGIGGRNVSDLNARLPVPDGVLIVQVQRGSGAEAAGLRGLSQTEDGDILLGDIVTGIDGERVKDNDDLYRILDKHQVGDTVRVDVFRDGRTITVPVRLMPSRGQRGN
jgi:S1-C subfamily serine protease